jgi:hypothetical protein
MALIRNWVRSRPFLAFLAFAIVLAALVFALWPKQRITKANFDKIQAGMSQEELRQLLGTPYFDNVQLGLVIDPQTFAPPSGPPGELRRKGYKEYRWQNWASSEISIGVVSDSEGQVVCRYSQPGQEWDWREFLRSLIFW